MRRVTIHITDEMAALWGTFPETAFSGLFLGKISGCFEILNRDYGEMVFPVSDIDKIIVINQKPIMLCNTFFELLV